MERLFVDTSAWFAHANREDPRHKDVVRVLEDFPGGLVTSSFVFDETITLCAYRLGHRVAASVGEVLQDPDEIELLRVTAEDERAAWKLFLGRPDKAYSFTDCTSFVMMRRLGITTAASLDDDFAQEGFRVVP
jgi:uncharacterized protein